MRDGGREREDGSLTHGLHQRLESTTLQRASYDEKANASSLAQRSLGGLPARSRDLGRRPGACRHGRRYGGGFGGVALLDEAKVDDEEEDQRCEPDAPCVEYVWRRRGGVQATPELDVDQKLGAHDGARKPSHGTKLVASPTQHKKISVLAQRERERERESERASERSRRNLNVRVGNELVVLTKGWEANEPPQPQAADDQRMWRRNPERVFEEERVQLHSGPLVVT